VALAAINSGSIAKSAKGSIIMSLTVIVITLNEERHIAECLESVRWADEIIVMDSQSTDRTVAISREFTSKVFIKQFNGYSENKNSALQQATSEWILWLDADERVTSELAEEIQSILAARPPQNGFAVPRKAFFLGRWIRHCGWYPGYVVRLFRRQGARFSDSKVHEGVVITGPSGRLRNALLHYTDDSVEHYLWKLNRYTTLAAQDGCQTGKKSGMLDILFRPWIMFFKMYFLRLGFLDGIEGFILCLLSSGHVALKYAKIWEIGQDFAHSKEMKKNEIQG
jgi:glycosyltransferase involved in cell wall biosynthesis